MSKGKITGIIIVAVVAIILGLVITTIFKTDPYAETVEAACYPDLVKTWEKKQPGNRLYVMCMKPDGTVTKEVEVKRKPGM